MDAASPPDPAGESAQLLLALRHALADPLSSAALKLDLVERRLVTSPGADPSWVLERVRSTKAAVDTASSLLDLLLRVADIQRERRTVSSVHDLCRSAGVALQGDAIPALRLRRDSTTEAIRNVASYASSSDGAVPSPARAACEGDRVTLSIEGPRVTVDGHPERLLDLPHGIEGAEALFVARAAVEADGGCLTFTERAGRLVALFSWPIAGGGT